MKYLALFIAAIAIGMFAGDTRTNDPVWCQVLTSIILLVEVIATVVFSIIVIIQLINWVAL